MHHKILHKELQTTLKYSVSTNLCRHTQVNYTRVADPPGHHYLYSACSNQLIVPLVKLSTVGGRAFPVAGPTIWNNLPDNVT